MAALSIEHRTRPLSVLVSRREEEFQAISRKKTRYTVTQSTLSLSLFSQFQHLHHFQGTEAPQAVLLVMVMAVAGCWFGPWEFLRHLPASLGCPVD